MPVIYDSSIETVAFGEVIEELNVRLNQLTIKVDQSLEYNFKIADVSEVFGHPSFLRIDVENSIHNDYIIIDFDSDMQCESFGITVADELIRYHSRRIGMLELSKNILQEIDSCDLDAKVKLSFMSLVRKTLDSMLDE